MVKMLEREFAQKLVYAPNEVLDKDLENDTIGDTRSEVNVENVSNQVQNAFDIWMVQGVDTPSKHPEKALKGYRNVLSERKVLEREIKLIFFSSIC